MPKLQLVPSPMTPHIQDLTHCHVYRLHFFVLPELVGYCLMSSYVATFEPAEANKCQQLIGKSVAPLYPSWSRWGPSMLPPPPPPSLRIATSKASAHVKTKDQRGVTSGIFLRDAGQKLDVQNLMWSWLLTSSSFIVHHIYIYSN